MKSLTQLSNCLTLEGSFSSVSTATIARKGAFAAFFGALQGLNSFAPLRPEKFSKFSSQILHFFAIFKTKHQILTIFVANFAETQPNVVGISQITQKKVQNAENQKKTAKN